MSKKTDIIDGTAADIEKKTYGLIYTCRLGWVDLGHANPKGALGLWNDIVLERGTKSKDGKGFQLTYDQSMTGLKITVRHERKYYVRYGLTKEQKESIALRIFMEVSLGFESMQSSFPYNLRTDSGFSAEDLVSDLLGFYRAVRPRPNYIFLAEPVSKAAAIKVWEDTGEVGKNKNQSFAVFIYSCSECTINPGGGACMPLPTWLNEITPAVKGTLFRDWDPKKDENYFRWQDGFKL